MGYFTDPNNNFTIYDAPKGGGSTVRAWIYYAGTGNLHLESLNVDGYYSGGSDEPRQLGEWGYKLDYFREVPGERVCIKRDPVSRFISCYEDKIIKEGKLNRIGIDPLLDNFEHILKTNDHPHLQNTSVGFMWYHFAPQTEIFGKDVEYYTHVFNLSEVGVGLKSYLEGKWSIELPDIHCRKNSKRRIELTDEQISKVKEIYSDDYKYGWF